MSKLSVLILAAVALGSLPAVHAHGATSGGGCFCVSCHLARYGAGGAAVDLSQAEQAVSAPFRIGARWTSTSATPNAPTQGTPVTLRWSIVPDGTAIPGGQVAGESSDGSNLISYMDGIFGTGPGGSDLTQRPWFTHYSSSFARWSALSGLSYIFEPNDDGSDLYTFVPGSGTFGGLGGQAGVRGDVRISGHAIDGPNGVLAYNFFPSIADMVIDTSESSNFASSSNNFRFLRNVLMHEHGHGLGFAHLESSNSSQLMEPFINASFDGPQFDDILAVQRSYGDAREKGLGNDTAARATVLGSVSLGGPQLQIGTSAGATSVVSSTQTDFVSIDDDSDIDFYRVTTLEQGGLTITLTPRGPTYNEGPQGGAQSSFVSSALGNLTLAVVGPDLLTTLISVNLTGLGGIETITLPVLGGANYFVRVGGVSNQIQMYLLQVSLVSGVIPEPGALVWVGVVGMGLVARKRR